MGARNNGAPERAAALIEGECPPGQEGIMQMKKNYRKPVLNTRRLELGVFGDYGSDRGGNVPPTPVSVIEGLRLHME
jgi:hypothetical protein